MPYMEELSITTQPILQKRLRKRKVFELKHAHSRSLERALKEDTPEQRELCQSIIDRNSIHPGINHISLTISQASKLNKIILTNMLKELHPEWENIYVIKHQRRMCVGFSWRSLGRVIDGQIAIVVNCSPHDYGGRLFD